MFDETHDTTDTAPHEYTPCAGHRCHIVVRDGRYCAYHTVKARAVRHMARLVLLRDLYLSVDLATGTQEHAEGVAALWTQLKMWGSALGMHLGQRARMRRAPNVGAAVGFVVSR